MPLHAEELLARVQATHAPPEPHCGVVPVHAVSGAHDPVASQVFGVVMFVHALSPGLHVTHTPSRQAGTDPEQIEPFASQTPPMHVCG